MGTQREDENAGVQTKMEQDVQGKELSAPTEDGAVQEERASSMDTIDVLSTPP